MENYIGISENKLHHILAVARQCYKIAKSENKSEEFCQKMWMIGWNHDIGYEFSQTPKEHNEISTSLCQAVGICDNNVLKAIQFHGEITSIDTDEWRILNIADLTIDSKGHNVPIMGRLDEIQKRYGKTSSQYINACDIAYKIGLTNCNVSK